MKDRELSVSAVEDERAHRQFCELPYQHYRGDALWAPPLRRDERRRWSEKHNPTLKGRWVRRFIARRGGRAVGRLAAIIDPAFASRWEPGSAFFGFFECEDHLETANALLKAGEGAVRGHGARRILGPINLSTHDETGILVDGFDSPPMVASPYNPPYYAQLLGAAGYLPIRDYHAHIWAPVNSPDANAKSILRAFQDNLGRRSGVRVRPMNPRKWDAEIAKAIEVYNSAFQDVWGFVPILPEDFAGRAAMFRPFLRPELALLAEAGGRPVGFALTLSDVNEALRAAGGRLLPFGWLRMGLRLAKVRTARFIILGVIPDYVGKGVATMLGNATYLAAIECGIERAELSLVDGQNERMLKVLRNFGAMPTKTYRIFGKTIEER